MENRSHALWTGIFTVLLGAILLCVLVWFTQDQPKRRVYELHTTRTVSGLNQHAMVKYRGIEIGRVSSLKFNPSNAGEIVIEIQIDANAPISQNTYATLDYQGITGLAFVQLNTPEPTGPLLETSVNHPAQIELKPSLLENVTSRGEAILAQTEQLTKNLNSLLNPQNVNAISESLKNISVATQAMPDMLNQANLAFKQVGRASDAVTDTMKPWEHMGKEADKLVAGLSKPNGSLTQLERSLSELNKTLGDARLTLSHVRAQTLPRLNTTLEEAGAALQGINQTVETIGNNPSRILFDDLPDGGPGEPGFKFPKNKGTKNDR